MATEHFQKASDILVKAKKELGEVLGSVEHSHALLGANQSLDNLINRMNVLSGNPTLKNEKITHKPVTSFMGKAVNRPKKIAQAELSPEAHRVDSFRQKVTKLYADFVSQEPLAIIESHKTNDDLLVLRGVAKRAGIEDYEDAEITVKFIEQVQEAIEKKAATKAGEDKIDKELNKAKKEKAEDENLTPQQKAAATKAKNKAKKEN